jgi:hypothetical protein
MAFLLNLRCHRLLLFVFIFIGILFNAVSLDALSINNHKGTMTRGRSQNSAHKGSLLSRASKIRQQSLAPYGFQQPNITTIL